MTQFEVKMLEIQKERNQILKDAFVTGRISVPSAPEKIAIELMEISRNLELIIHAIALK